MKRFCTSVALLMLVLPGCESKTPTDADNQPPAEAAKPAPLDKEVVAGICKTIEDSIGNCQLDEDGQPIAIDLGVERGSATPEAFQASLKCARLTKFSARADKISKDDLLKLSELKSLRELSLQDADFTDEAFKTVVAGLPDLQRLQIRNSPNVSDAGIAALKSAANLTALSLLDMQITGASLDTIAELPKLKALDIRMCNAIPGADLVKLAKAEQLKELKVAGYGIDDASMSVVAALPKLESLTVENAGITGEGLNSLANNKSLADRLKILGLTRCSSLGDDALAALHKLPNLRRLSIRDIPVNGSFLKDLPTAGQLELLALNQVFLSPEAYDDIARCKNLKRLELAQSFLTREDVEKIAELSGLEYLNLTECGLDDSIVEPLAKLKNLKTFIAEENPDLTEKSELPQ